MSIFAIDANIPITFIKVGIWDVFEEYIKKSKHSVVMPEEVYYEVKDQKTKSIFQHSDIIKKVKVNESLFLSIKNDCISMSPSKIQDNDYKLITSAFEENVNYLVSNDYHLNKIATLYFKNKQIRGTKTRIISPPGLFWLMYLERKDVFEFEKNIKTNLEYYSIIEISRMYNGIKEDRLDCDDCLNVFKTYSLHIRYAISDYTK